MSKTLVIVYSYTGTGRKLARLLAAQQSWPTGDVLELRSRAGAWGTLRCVLDSLLRRHPSVRYAGPRVNEFDSVVLITPIWLGRLAGPMRSFIANYAESLPDLALIAVSASGRPSSAAAEVAELADRTPLLEAAFTASEIDDGSCAARLQAFGNAVRSRRGGGAPVRPVEISTQNC
jgi:hypothetical protein